MTRRLSEGANRVTHAKGAEMRRANAEIAARACDHCGVEKSEEWVGYPVLTCTNPLCSRGSYTDCGGSGLCTNVGGKCDACRDAPEPEPPCSICGRDSHDTEDHHP